MNRKSCSIRSRVPGQIDQHRVAGRRSFAESPNLPGDRLVGRAISDQSPLSHRARRCRNRRGRTSSSWCHVRAGCRSPAPASFGNGGICESPHADYQGVSPASALLERLQARNDLSDPGGHGVGRIPRDKVSQAGEGRRGVAPVRPTRAVPAQCQAVTECRSVPGRPPFERSRQSPGGVLVLVEREEGQTAAPDASASRSRAPSRWWSRCASPRCCAAASKGRRSFKSRPRS